MSGDYQTARTPALLVTSGAVALFLLLPLTILVIQSFTGEAFLGFPPTSFGVRWYRHIVQDEKWLSVIRRTLSVATVVAPLALIVGTMAALAIDRGPRRGRALLYGLLISPMVLPHVVLALGFFRLVLMLQSEDSFPAIMVGHLVVSVPYVVVTVTASLQTLQRDQEEAAQSLGAGAWSTFWHVILPGLRPGLIGGAIFAFIESFDEFIITFFVTTFNVTLPIQIFNSLSFELDPSIAAISSAALAVTMLLTGVIMLRGQIVSGGRIVR